MLDDLRNSAKESYIEEEIQPVSPLLESKPRNNFLGMTAPQRFVLSLLLLFAVIVLGSFCLLITGKIVIP